MINEVYADMVQFKVITLDEVPAENIDAVKFILASRKVEH